MTNKELLYVEDALGHISFLKESFKDASNKLMDVPLSNYMKELKQEQDDIFNNFYNLL